MTSAVDLDPSTFDLHHFVAAVNSLNASAIPQRWLHAHVDTDGGGGAHSGTATTTVRMHDGCRVHGPVATAENIILCDAVELLDGCDTREVKFGSFVFVGRGARVACAAASASNASRGAVKAPPVELAVGDYVYIGAGASISDSVHSIGMCSMIGDHAVIGPHCTIGEGARIAAHTVIPAGAVVPSHSFVYALSRDGGGAPPQLRVRRLTAAVGEAEFALLQARDAMCALVDAAA
jgi:acetyltransferase-like isoleucine patch superfamily enzyme